MSEGSLFLQCVQDGVRTYSGTEFNDTTSSVEIRSRYELCTEDRQEIFYHFVQGHKFYFYVVFDSAFNQWKHFGTYTECAFFLNNMKEK